MDSPPVKKWIVKQTIANNDHSATSLLEFLAKRVPLSKATIKKTLNHGGCWLRSARGRNKGKLLRIRRATYRLQAQDYIEFYYDQRVMEATGDLAAIAPLFEHSHYGVWYKPAGILSQGTIFGDHCALLRWVEKQRGRAYLVHRLDRDVQGLIVVAYSRPGAGKLGVLFQQNQIEKWYVAEVHGVLPADEQQRSIDMPIDGKRALTHYWVRKNGNDSSMVSIRLATGRHHQIRRHFAAIHHPVVGDGHYGSSLVHCPLRLAAIQLRFICPFEQQHRDIILSSAMIPWADAKTVGSFSAARADNNRV